MSLAANPDTAPTLEPVTLAEAKSHAQIVTTDDDSNITSLIAWARRYSEDRTGRAFNTQTWKEYWDVFPDDQELRLSKSPVQSVTTITYIDTAGDVQTIDSSVYQTDFVSEPSRIRPAFNQSWPTLRGGDLNAIVVTFVAGYGDDAADVPDRYVFAIKVAVATWYNIREHVTIGQALQEVRISLDAALQGDKLWQF